MDSAAKERLVTAHRQLLASRAAGSARFAIAESYQSVDNLFSAVLPSQGNKSPTNHRRKLDQALDVLGSLLTADGISRTDVEGFYGWWLRVRYEEATPTSAEAFRLSRLATRLHDVALGFFASADGVLQNDILEILYEDVLGSRFLSFEPGVAAIHERWQEEAEAAASEGLGSSIGNKALNPSNFCDLAAFADDEMTRDLLSNDLEVGEAVASYYNAFVQLVALVREKRLEAGVEADRAPDFTLGVRLQYSGMSLAQIGETWGRAIAEALNRLDRKVH